MTPEELSEFISKILMDLKTAGELALEGDLPPVKVERPRNRDYGDWATNVAMQLAKRAGTNPRALAELLASKMGENAAIKAVEVAGPGFLNVRLNAGAAGELVRTILAAGPDYGKGNGLAGRVINLEFVSANPTGPIHIGGARWAAVCDAMARVFSAAGAEVIREYYFNDHGSQIDHFSASLLARAKGREVPEDGYGGQYISDVAQQVIDDALAAGEPDPRDLPEDEAQEVFRARGVELMFDEIKRSMYNFRTHFDVYFHEQSLHDSGAVTKAIEKLRERGAVYDEGGAVWIRSSAFGDDKDRVIIKSNGEPAYFAADIAYYLDKRRRGANWCLYFFGADHHGYIGRMYAMVRAFGDEAGPGKNMEIQIGQMVSLVRSGEPVRMSKRAGTVVTLEDLVDAVGVDAARFNLIRSTVDTTLELDLDVVSSHTNENPVYYVQYAHARTAAVARNAAEHGVEGEFDPTALDAPADSELLGTLARFPEVVAQSAQLSEPHRVARYLEELAGAYHGWYSKTRVTPRGDDPVEAGHIARLYLSNATRQVLENGLELLGVSAPDRM
ncbi:MAG: arginine--tRNA ligase [Actinomycetaceae bacterium]|nr:arginine--tRNA ligase [Actinomycetaceae bacterium]